MEGWCSNVCCERACERAHVHPRPEQIYGPRVSDTLHRVYIPRVTILKGKRKSLQDNAAKLGHAA